MYRQIGEDATVQIDTGFFQTADQTAVAQIVDAGLRVDARDPQRAKLTLALTTVAVGVLPRLGNRLLGDAKHTRARAIITLGLLENFLVSSMGDDTAFHARHGFLLCLQLA